MHDDLPGVCNCVRSVVKLRWDGRPSQLWPKHPEFTS